VLPALPLGGVVPTRVDRTEYWYSLLIVCTGHRHKHDTLEVVSGIRPAFRERRRRGCE
jgi:hypothetical protein